MIYDYIRPTVAQANTLAAEGDMDGAYGALRTLPMADYCQVFAHLPAEFSALAKALPSMPTEAEQRRWTGHAGRELLIKSCSHMRLYQNASLSLRGRSIEGPILDYGSGWGRMCRYMSYFGGPDKIHGVDPMQDSLDACAKHRVAGTFSKIDNVPKTFPIPDVLFDFVFSFSVMTHTPHHVTQAILKCVRTAMTPDALFVTSIRPVEFWKMRAGAIGEKLAGQMAAAHHETGYCFNPSQGGVELTEDLYGDSSYSIDYFANMAAEAGLEIAKIDRDVMEPFQIMVILKPV